MRNSILILSLGTAVALAAVGVPMLLMAGNQPAGTPAPGAIPEAEHRSTVEDLKPPKRQRPAIAILALNEGTEVSDFLTAYGVLAESGVADVTVVADRADPIRLYPSLTVETQATTTAFDERYPEGADYVVIPAMEPHDNPAVIAWIRTQHAKGAKIVSICNGSLTMAAAGLLNGRRATGHWYSIGQIETQHPSMQRVRDRRYVVDRGVATSTGITASIPLMLTLVEAIGGRSAAETLAARLGVATWDARHTSAAFQLNSEHRKTYVRNKLSFWRHATVGIKITPPVDEIALGLMIDAYSRTELTKVATVGESEAFVQSRRGLRLRPDTSARAARTDTMLEPQSAAPARALDRELARIERRFDKPTAALVALTMEYPWSSH